MARVIHDPRLETRSARQALPVSKNPVWRHLTRTRHLGYRRNRQAGTWYVRLYTANRYRMHRLGQADDCVDADGAVILSYDQAIERAQTWCEKLAAAAHGYTVLQAVEDYQRYLASEGKPSARNVGWLISAHLSRLVESERGRMVPLADIEVTDLTPQALRDWRAWFLEAGLSRATANNHLAVLKAALSRAFQDRPKLVPSDHAWRRVKPLRNAHQPRVGYYTVEQASQLMAACESDFADLVEGALLTGCRHGELRRLNVSDYHPDAGRPWIHIITSKSGRGRKVFLDDQGADLFDRLCEGRDLVEPMFLASVVTGVLCAMAGRNGRPGVDRLEAIKQRLQGVPSRTRQMDSETVEFIERATFLGRNELFTEEWRRWRRQSQVRRMTIAAKRLGLQIKNFHALRHTYASLLVQAGVPLKFVAEQLGHTSTRMVEVHYGHLSPSVVAEAIRANMPQYGCQPASGLRLVDSIPA